MEQIPTPNGSRTLCERHWRANPKLSTSNKKIVDKGWPDDMEGIAKGDRAAERQTQGRQRIQRYNDYTL